MFKNVNKKFLVTRGDAGTINFYLPIKGENGYLSYKDSNGDSYWYDTKNKKLYDNSYQESTKLLKDLEMQLHKFQKGDLVRFKVFRKKDCACIEIKKDVLVEEETTNVFIPLTKEDTTIGDLITKPVEYWYEVELNPDTAPQTVVCFDETGAKIFELYPEGADE